MPEISRFHNPPHFHAQYAGREAHIDIRNLAVISGALPTRATGMVVEWASLHQDDLLELWEAAKNLQPLHSIDPLP